MQEENERNNDQAAVDTGIRGFAEVAQPQKSALEQTQESIDQSRDQIEHPHRDEPSKGADNSGDKHQSCGNGEEDVANAVENLRDTDPVLTEKSAPGSQDA
jgi:hypothetical protein